VDFNGEAAVPRIRAAGDDVDAGSRSLEDAVTQEVADRAVADPCSGQLTSRDGAVLAASQLGNRTESPGLVRWFAPFSRGIRWS
jgi:hypothetical protein